MATENQLRALGSWLNRDILQGEAICEMPAGICSVALSKLSSAAAEYQNGGNHNGGIKKVKQEIIAELREEGWISVPADASKKPNEKEMFGDRAHAEAQRITEEQRLATTPTPTEPAAHNTLPELIRKYTSILSEVTEAVKAEDRIPDREKGYATKFIYDSVNAALENGRDHEEQA